MFQSMRAWIFNKVYGIVEGANIPHDTKTMLLNVLEKSYNVGNKQ